MRTTINFNDATAAAMTEYLQRYEEVFGRRRSPSDLVDEAVRTFLIRAVDRLPRPEEAVEDMLMRRATELRSKIEAPGLAAAEIEDLMKEALALRDGCEAAFLRGGVTSADFLDAYKRTSSAATAAYNAGAMRMNESVYVFPVRAWEVSPHEVAVGVHRTAVGYRRITENLLCPGKAAGGVSLGTASSENADWTRFQLMLNPPRDSQSIHGLVEHLVYPLKVSWMDE